MNQTELYRSIKLVIWRKREKSYLSMKRNKQTMTRGSNHVFHAGLSIPYTDDRLTFEIPRAEISRKLNELAAKLFPGIPGEQILNWEVLQTKDGIHLSLNIRRAAFLNYIERLTEDYRAKAGLRIAA